MTRRLLRRFARNRMAPARRSASSPWSALMAMLAPVPLSPGAPSAWPARRCSHPSADFLLGTDALGRDVAAGVVAGRAHLAAHRPFAALVAVLVGTVIGGFAGYYGGAVDNVLMRLTEFFQTIPSFLLRRSAGGDPLALHRSASSSPSPSVSLAADRALGAGRVPRPARTRIRPGLHRVRRGATRGSSSGTSCPTASRRSSSPARCWWPRAILIESGLAFLGLGDPNVMSWGLHDRRRPRHAALRLVGLHHPGRRHPAHRAVDQPGRRGLNDALNPRLRER